MADPEHVKVLRQGAEAWNAWRSQNPDERADLSGADLTGANLRETDLTNANLDTATGFWQNSLPARR